MKTLRRGFSERCHRPGALSGAFRLWTARPLVPTAAAIIIALAGCAGQPTATIPIATSCVKEAPSVPSIQQESEILSMDDYAATLTVWTERLLLKAYAAKAEAVISACR